MTLFDKKFASLSIITFLFIVFFPFGAKAWVENCGTTQFSNKMSSEKIIFPPGGSTNTDVKVLLPIGAVIGDASVDLTPVTIIKTPYIWIPNTGSGTLAQLRTSNGELVKLYTNSTPGFPANAFVDHSRVTVIPGGDVYVANKGNNYITRLVPKTSPAEDYNYEGQLDMGTTPIRMVTVDSKGYLWGGTYGGSPDRIRVFCITSTTCGINPIGTQMAELINGKRHYGGIGDKYGFVWTVGDGEVRSYSYDNGVITEISTGSVPDSYGIGIDNDQNIWVGKRGPSAGVHKVSRNSSGGITSINTYFSTLSDNTGVAADGTGNVWVDGWGSNRVSRFNTNGALIANYDAGGNPHGAAIDFYNNVWLVNYIGGAPPSKTVSNPSGCAAGTGSVTVYKSDGIYVNTYTTCGNNPYNYSDMTGFRSLPSTFTLNSFSTNVSISGKTTVSGWGRNLQTILTECASPGVISGTNCEVPLSLFSITGGTYTADKLSIACSLTHPSILGGLVPCGRLDDNLDTGNIDESAPCDLCSAMYMLKQMLNFAIEIAVGIAVFIIILGGFLYAFSAGNPANVEKAKSAITHAIIGLVIMFSAWLIVAAILNAMGYADITTWNQVSCALQTK